MNDKTLQFWGFRIYGRLEYQQEHGTVLIFDAAPDQICHPKPLFDLCYFLYRLRLKMENPTWTFEDKALFICRFLEKACKLRQGSVTADLITDYLQRSP
jgi:hypothetical protein